MSKLSVWMPVQDCKSLHAVVVIKVRPIPHRRPILDIIGCSYTNTDTGLYKFFVLKM